MSKYYILANSSLRRDFPRPPAPPLGAFGAPVGVPAVPIWETAAFGGGERSNKLKLIWGTTGAPYLGNRGRPGRGVSLAYAAFGGDEKKKNWGTFGAPNFRRLRRPKWFSRRDPFQEDSKYVLGFEIGLRKSGFYSERTESQTDRRT